MNTKDVSIADYQKNINETHGSPERNTAVRIPWYEHAQMEKNINGWEEKQMLHMW